MDDLQARISDHFAMQHSKISIIMEFSHILLTSLLEKDYFI